MTEHVNDAYKAAKDKNIVKICEYLESDPKLFLEIDPKEGQNGCKVLVNEGWKLARQALEEGLKPDNKFFIKLSEAINWTDPMYGLSLNTENWSYTQLVDPKSWNVDFSEYGKYAPYLSLESDIIQMKKCTDGSFIPTSFIQVLEFFEFMQPTISKQINKPKEAKKIETSTTKHPERPRPQYYIGLIKDLSAGSEPVSNSTQQYSFSPSSPSS